MDVKERSWSKVITDNEYYVIYFTINIATLHWILFRISSLELFYDNESVALKNSWRWPLFKQSYHLHNIVMIINFYGKNEFIYGFPLLNEFPENIFNRPLFDLEKLEQGHW